MKKVCILPVLVIGLFVNMGTVRAQVKPNRNPDQGFQTDTKGTTEEAQHWKLVVDLMSRGDNLFYESKWDEALAVYQQVEKIAPDAHFCYEGIGDVALKKGDTATAISNYKQAIKFDNTAINRFRLAVAYGHEHDYQDAITEYEIGLRAFRDGFPDDLKDLLSHPIEPNEGGMNLLEATTLTYRGNELLGYGKSDRAIVLLRQAIQLEPHLAETHLALGYAYHRTHKLTDARAETEKAISEGHGHVWERAQGYLKTLPHAPTKTTEAANTVN